MAAPVASYVQLPVDTSNTGKKNRTQTRVVGSDTVHEHHVVPSPDTTKYGRYIACSTGLNTVSTVAQTGAAGGYYWLHMSTAATAVGVLRHASMTYSQQGTAVPSFTAPQYMLSK